MPAVTAIHLQPTFPVGTVAKKSLASSLVNQLTSTWFGNGLPSPAMFYLLVHRPGELGRNEIQVTHRADQAEAMEQESGLTAVAVTLTDVLEGAEDLVVLQIRRTGP